MIPRYLLLASILLAPLCGGVVSAEKPQELPIDKHYIFYLLQSREWNRAIDLYEKYKESLGHHDNEVLTRMAKTLLETTAKSEDPQEQLASLFASSIVGLAPPLSTLNTALFKGAPQTQLAAVILLGTLQDDRSEALLAQAMSSEFVEIRLEAIHQLCLRKAKTAVGHIESLMQRFPPEARSFFPQFFALIGTHDAIAQLRQLIDDRMENTRIAAILAAAHGRRDDLLPIIRSCATHPSPGEQEACAFALGTLKDSHALPLLEKLAASKHTHVRLAALFSLYRLGHTSSSKEICALAKEGDLCAIALLQYIEGSEDLLATLLDAHNIQVRFNAVRALLAHRDVRVIPYLEEFLIHNEEDLGFEPRVSPGGSILCWKVMASTHLRKHPFRNLAALSLSVREEMLRTAIDLPAPHFLEVAHRVFEKKQHALIPCLIEMLEHRPSDEVEQLLRQKAQLAGAPFIRTYCQLALMRMTHTREGEQEILHWVRTKKRTNMLRFRPLIAKSELPEALDDPLTQEENAHLLRDAYATLAENHNALGIDILLDAIAHGHPKNRAILAALLLHAIE